MCIRDSGYTVTPAQRDECGTNIVLTLKDNTEQDNYDEFLQEYRLRGIVTKYSDYIRYPIRMPVEKSRMVEGLSLIHISIWCR